MPQPQARTENAPNSTQHATRSILEPHPGWPLRQKGGAKQPERQPGLDSFGGQHHLVVVSTVKRNRGSVHMQTLEMERADQVNSRCGNRTVIVWEEIPVPAVKNRAGS